MIYWGFIGAEATSDGICGQMEGERHADARGRAADEGLHGLCYAWGHVQVGISEPILPSPFTHPQNHPRGRKGIFWVCKCSLASKCLYLRTGADGSRLRRLGHFAEITFVYLCVAPETSLDHFRRDLSARELLDGRSIDQVHAGVSGMEMEK